MAQWDVADFVMRLKSNFGGKRWAGSYYDPASNSANAWNDGTDSNPVGQLYALLRPVAVQFSAMMLTMWPYVRLQTRLTTITDEFVDLAWLDFFRGRDARRVGEQDSTSRARLMAEIIALTGTKTGVLGALQRYLALYPLFNSTVDVFDRQTDPARSAYYGILDSQFAVIFYTTSTSDNAGWFVGQQFVGQDTFVNDPYGFTASETAPNPGIAATVNQYKDLGYRPIYIVSRGEAPPTSDTWGSDWGSMTWG